jgi:HAD superfamily hydrolase (TIGR01509 family)
LLYVEEMVNAILFDVDGTLVNSNDAHAHAWVRAFSEHGLNIPFESVRRAIGMGGDQLLPHVAGIRDDSEQGERIAARRKEIFKREYLPALKPMRGSAALVSAINMHRITAVAASSAEREELEPLLAIAGATSLLSRATSADDADRSKPYPDIVQAALQMAEVDAADALLIGDTPYDIEAAGRAGVATIAVRCGGWSDADLKGAIAIYDGPWDLLQQLDNSPIIASTTVRVLRTSTANAPEE